MRRDLQPLQDWDEIAVDLEDPHRSPLRPAADRTRAINRMRAQLLEYFPALERAFDYAAAAAVVQTLAKAVLALDEEISSIDLKIAARFREHRDAEVIVSMPGMGPLLGAEFIACTGGDMDAFGSAGRLAGVAGLTPVPRDSGRVSGNMRDHTATTVGSYASSTSPHRSPPGWLRSRSAAAFVHWLRRHLVIDKFLDVHEK